MQPRWTGVMWVISAAMLLGFLVATMTGGVAPPWWLFVLFVALPATIALVGPTVVNRRPPQASRGGHSGSDPQPGIDWNVVSEISCALDSRDVAWLRSTDFVTPWLDSHARRAIELAPFVAGSSAGHHDLDLGERLRILSAAIDAFADFYQQNTVPDPLLLGADWRFFEWDEEGATKGSVGGGDLSAGRAAHLHLLAAEAADAYEGFTAIAARYPNVRPRAETRVSRDRTFSF